MTYRDNVLDGVEVEQAVGDRLGQADGAVGTITLFSEK
jgi:hypothetical protein